MLAGQKGYGANGLQNFLFPLDYLYITQGSYYYTYSHNGCYAMDFVGTTSHYPYYAPFDCHCVAKWGSSSPQVVWQSNNEVNFIDGTTGYACIGFNHDNNIPNIHVGDTKLQGEVIGHTGTYGGVGDHVHIEAKKGTYQGYHQNSQGVYMLTGSTWLYDLFGVNDTTLAKTYYDNHNGQRVYYTFRDFTINLPYPPTPPIPVIREGKFPWVLYAKKLREKG